VSVAKALPGGSEVYMLGLAAFCWTIWKTRNGVCFEKKRINNPIEILFSTCAFMRYWAGMYLEVTKKMIKAGVNVMMKMAAQILKREAHQAAAPVLRIRGADPEADDDGIDLDASA
jgi:hypothetical protein